MSYLYRFFLIIALLITISAQAHEFQFEQLKSLATSSKSIEEVLSKLPRKLTTQFSLILDSKSLQYGDTINPRAILFNDDASFTLAFSGDPDKRGFNSIEGTIFDRKTARFIPYSIIYSDDHQPIIETNSRRCIGCHTKDFKPILEPFPFWSKAYGSLSSIHHDTSTISIAESQLTRKENNLLKEFLKRRITHPRYHVLKGRISLDSLAISNVKLSDNLLYLQSLRIKRMLLEKEPADGLRALLNNVFENLSDPRKPPIKICNFVPLSDRSGCSQEVYVYHERVKKTYQSQRVKLISQHFKAIGFEPVTPQQVFSEGFGFDDLDFGILKISTQLENERRANNHTLKLAGLNFLLAKYFKMHLGQINSSVFPGHLPTYRLSRKSGWNLLQL